MLTKKLMREILSHAEDEYPNELCGVVSGGKYFRCRNAAKDPTKEVVMDKYDMLEFADKIEAFVHSHPDASSRMSQSDKVQMEFFGVPYIIVGYPAGDFGFYVPTGYKAPLLGRQFYHGILDCYTLVRDFYDREMGISIPDFERADKWWEDEHSTSLYMQNFAEAGFTPVDNLQYGDVIICTVGDTKYPNHALIYLGENGKFRSEETTDTFGTNMFLHHMYGRKSTREVYGDQWKDKTKVVVRHKEKL